MGRTTFTALAGLGVLVGSAWLRSDDHPEACGQPDHRLEDLGVGEEVVIHVLYTGCHDASEYRFEFARAGDVTAEARLGRLGGKLVLTSETLGRIDRTLERYRSGPPLSHSFSAVRVRIQWPACFEDLWVGSLPPDVSLDGAESASVHERPLSFVELFDLARADG